jgi:hypothetical protein
LNLITLYYLSYLPLDQLGKMDQQGSFLSNPNQRIKPVESNSVILEFQEREVDDEQWTQTGYKQNAVGMTLYVLVMLLHLEFQILLLFFSIEYCELCLSSLITIQRLRKHSSWIIYKTPNLTTAVGMKLPF